MRAVRKISRHIVADGFAAICLNKGWFRLVPGPRGKVEVLARDGAHWVTGKAAERIFRRKLKQFAATLPKTGRC